MEGRSKASFECSSGKLFEKLIIFLSAGHLIESSQGSYDGFGLVTENRTKINQLLGKDSISILTKAITENGENWNTEKVKTITYSVCD